MTECFTVMSDEINGRLDSFYYRPEFYELLEQLNGLKWKIVKLSEIFEINRGGSPRPIHKFFTTDENGVNWIKIGDTKGIDKYLCKTKQKIKPEGVKFSREVKEGDFILSNSMSFGRPYIMKTKGCIHDGWLLLREKDKNLNKDFLYYLLSTNFIYRFFKRATIGGVVENLNIDLVKEIKVPIPSLEIQNRIVQLMDKAYSSKKEKETKAKQLLDSINDYVLDELGIKLPELKDKMAYVVYSDDVKNNRCDAYYFQTKFEEIEKAVKKSKFEIKELKEISDKLLSGQRPKGGVGQIKTGIPSLGGEHVLSDGKIKTIGMKFIPEKFHKTQLKSRIHQKDILIVKDGATTEKIGIIPENYPFEEANINEHVFLLRVKNNINPYYVFSFLKSRLGQIQINRDITGGTITGIIRTLTENIKIPLPPLSIQNKIAEEVKQRMQKAEQLQKEAKKELEKAKQEVEKIILG